MKEDEQIFLHKSLRAQTVKIFAADKLRGDAVEVHGFLPLAVLKNARAVPFIGQAA